MAGKSVYHDWVGKKFGEWTVLKYEKPQGRSPVALDCQCSCGAFGKVRPVSLTSGQSTKCSRCAYDSRRRVAVGDQFNDWTVIAWVPNGDKGGNYLCRCKCGHERRQNAAKLTKGSTYSCIPCSSKKRWNAGKSLYTSLKSRAKRDGREVTITWDQLIDIIEKQEFKCALSGRDITLPANAKEFHQHQFTASIDRIDSSKGYVTDNCQWVHKRLNTMKNDYTKEDFVMYCRWVADYHIRTEEGVEHANAA